MLKTNLPLVMSTWPPPKLRGVQALLHRADDLLRVVLAAEHVGVGHARHRQVREGLAAAVAGGRRPSSAARSACPACSRAGCRPRSVTVRWVGLPSSSMLSEPRRFGSVPSSTTVTPRRRDALADAAGEGARALAIEVALEAVADGFVQQDARPARTEHDRHHAGRRRPRFQIDQRLVDGLVRVVGQTLLR